MIVGVKELPATRLCVHAQRQERAPEAGGLLVGRRYDGAVIVDAITEPSPTDRRERHAYALDVAHHLSGAARLGTLHEAGGEIVGSWHTHPQADPVPSQYDLASWERVRAEDPSQVHVIVGTEQVRAWGWTENGWSPLELVTSGGTHPGQRLGGPT